MNAKRNKKGQQRAAAIQYDAARDMAPKVVAKGRGEIAEKIVALAEEHGVPLYADPNLAQILEALDLDTEIPPALYRAVAEVLVFIYKLNNKL